MSRRVELWKWMFIRPWRREASERIFSIVVPSGKSIDSLPEDIKQIAGEVFILREKLKISPGEMRVALDTDEAIKNIEKHGFYIDGTEIKTHVA